MISTKKLQNLPNKEKLQKICKSISVLDAIISQDWEYRYYSYNQKWGKDEELFEMRDDCGDQMLILFTKNGCVINGFAHELYDFEENFPSKSELIKGIPDVFNDFILGEPVATIGTTFCIWTNENNQWQLGNIKHFEDGSEEMLSIFDGNPQTYIDFAIDYFEEDYLSTENAKNTVIKIYNHETLTREMVLSIVDELEDWAQLESDLEEIGYPYHF